MLLCAVFLQGAFSVSLASISPDGVMFFRRLSMMNETENCPLAIRNYVSKLPEREKVAQIFLINVPGNEEFSKESDLNEGIAPGGILFFKFNLQDDEEKITHFTNSIKTYYSSCGKMVPYLAVDHEGGRVNRLDSVSSNFPSQQTVAKYFSLDDASSLYEDQAKMLKKIGFDVNLAPVAEILTENNENFLGGRSFGSLDEVEIYGSVCVDSYLKRGVLPVLKHFPGNTNDDPHLGLPNLQASNDEFYELEKPFFKILSKSKYSHSQENVPCGILISHAIVGEMSDNLPACFSRKIVTDELQENMKFSGLVFSDDVYMSALKKMYPIEISAKNLILSGVDVVMSTGMRFLPMIDFLKNEMHKDKNLESRINQSCYKVLDAKRKMGYAKIIKSENQYSKVYEICGFPKMYDYSFVPVLERKNATR